MSAHTPGPWRVKGSGRGLILRIFAGEVDDIDTEIATVFRADHMDYEANARLIAAAPELLAALKRAVEVLDAEGIVYGNCDDEPLDVLSAARDAIAKAAPE